MTKYEVRINSKTKRAIVFEVPDSGSGRWKIKKSFLTETEAKNWVKDNKPGTSGW